MPPPPHLSPSSPLTWPLPPLLSGLCFSHFRSPTFSAWLSACPSLPLCHPLPLLFSSFCACVSAMCLHVLPGPCSVCVCALHGEEGSAVRLLARTGHPVLGGLGTGAAHFPSSPGKRMLLLLFFGFPSSPHLSPPQLLSHRSCKLAFACFVTAESLNSVTLWRRSKGCVDAVFVPSFSGSAFFWKYNVRSCKKDFLCICTALCTHAFQAEVNRHCSSRAVLTGSPGTIALADLSDWARMRIKTRLSVLSLLFLPLATDRSLVSFLFYFFLMFISLTRHSTLLLFFFPPSFVVSLGFVYRLLAIWSHSWNIY